MTQLWIASGNLEKCGELARLLEPIGCEIHSANEAPAPFHVVEDAPSFAGNAALKATALARIVGAAALGDDSGLCVDALGGRPGVLSARYAGENATDADRVARLLAELDAVPRENRRAHFTCHVCLAGPTGELIAAFEEHCRGFILDSPSGLGGFGYDPIFVADCCADRDHTPSFAELTPEQKDAISHRGRALRQLRAFLEVPANRQTLRP